MVPVSNCRGSYIKDVHRAGHGSSSEHFLSQSFPLSGPIAGTNGPEVLDKSSLVTLLTSEEARRRACHFPRQLSESLV